MTSCRVKGYLACGAFVALVCLIFTCNKRLAVANATLETGKLSQDLMGEGGSLLLTSKPSKSRTREVIAEVASDAEMEKFRRFFLPPIELKNASVGEAAAEIKRAYRETAVATGEIPLDLDIDYSDAQTLKPLNCVTPRATAGTVIRFVAAMTGNKMEGTLPNFQIKALCPDPVRSGKLDVPPDLPSILDAYQNGAISATEAKLPEDPFAISPNTGELGEKDPFDTTQPRPDLKSELLSLGFNGDLECRLSSGSVLSYKNFSEIELEQLKTLIELGSGGEFGSVQGKTTTKIIAMDSETNLSVSGGETLSDTDLQLVMREISMVRGADLLALPSVVSRSGEVAKVEISGPLAESLQDQSWTGVRMASSSVPYGLGTQIEFACETSDGGEEPMRIRERMTLPEGSSGVSVVSGKDGKTYVVMQGVTMIDATGRPIAAPQHP